MSKSPRHFLDISSLPLTELRNMLAASSVMKAKRKAHEKSDEPLAGKMLRDVLASGAQIGECIAEPERSARTAQAVDFKLPCGPSSTSM